jgi:hypothetical protein
MPLALRPPVRLIPVTASERHNNVPVRVPVVMRIDRSWCTRNNGRGRYQGSPMHQRREADSRPAAVHFATVKAKCCQ